MYMHTCGMYNYMHIYKLHVLTSACMHIRVPEGLLHEVMLQAYFHGVMFMDEYIYRDRGGGREGEREGGRKGRRGGGR